MKCEDREILISREIDGELDSRRRAELEEHINQCPRCAEFARRLRLIHDAAREIEAEEPDPGYWRELDERLKVTAESEVVSSMGTRRSPWALAVSAVAAVLILSIAVWILCVQNRELQAELAAAGKGEEDQGSGAPSWAVYELSDLVKPTPVRAVREQAQAFSQLSDYFRGGLTWFVQDGEQSELGLSNAMESTGAAELPGVSMFELWLMRLGPDAPARCVSNPTLALTPGAEASFRLKETPGIGEARFKYLCSAGDGGGIVLHLEFDVSETGETISLSAVADVAPDTPVPVSYARVGKYVYVLFLERLAHPGPKETGTEA